MRQVSPDDDGSRNLTQNKRRSNERVTGFLMNSFFETVENFQEYFSSKSAVEQFSIFKNLHKNVTQDTFCANLRSLIRDGKTAHAGLRPYLERLLIGIAHSDALTLLGIDPTADANNDNADDKVIRLLLRNCRRKEYIDRALLLRNDPRALCSPTKQAVRVPIEFRKSLIILMQDLGAFRIESCGKRRHYRMKTWMKHYWDDYRPNAGKVYKIMWTTFPDYCETLANGKSRGKIARGLRLYRRRGASGNPAKVCPRNARKSQSCFMEPKDVDLCGLDSDEPDPADLDEDVGDEYEDSDYESEYESDADEDDNVTISQDHHVPVGMRLWRACLKKKGENGIYLCRKKKNDYCDICNNLGPAREATLARLKADPSADKKKIMKFQNLVNKYHMHQFWLECQFHWLNQLRAALIKGDVLIILDFGKEYVSNGGWVQIMVAHCVYPGGGTNNYLLLYSKQGAGDGTTAIYGLKWLFENVFKSYRRIFLSGDCGSGFRGWMLHCWLSSLHDEYGFIVQFHMRPPRHGSGPQDGILNAAFVLMEYDICTSVVITLMQAARSLRGLKNSVVHVLGDVDQMMIDDEDEPLVPFITATNLGISFFIHFRYPHTGFMLGRLATGAGRWVIWNLSGNPEHAWCERCSRLTLKFVPDHTDGQKCPTKKSKAKVLKHKGNVN